MIHRPTEMCNTTQPEVDTCIRKGKKRKSEFEEFDEIFVPPKRISPFLNTPRERKEERKRVLKISMQKLKHLEDPETFLRRSVLINNTMKRLQTEVRDEKSKQSKYGYRKRRADFSYGVLNNSCLSSSYLYDDPFLCNVHEKITDDMTDTLMSNLRDKLGDETEVVNQSKPEVSQSKPEVMEQSVSDDSQSNKSIQSKCNQNCSQSALCPHCNNNNNNVSEDSKENSENVQSEYQTEGIIEESNFIVREKLTDDISTSEKYDHFCNDVRTTYLTPNDFRNSSSNRVPESFINQSVYNCSSRLDINMIIEQEVTSHSDMKSSVEYPEYSRNQSHFQDGIYAY